MYSREASLTETTLRVGLVGTGSAAKLRAEALQQSQSAKLVAIAGHRHENTIAFADKYTVEVMDSWQQLIARKDLDLVFIATVNQEHGRIARAALMSGKHIVIEYPICLDVREAEELIALAKAENKLLHVEHIELLGSWHQALRQHLPQLGNLFYAHYTTVNPQYPAPQKWTYQHQLFGFPLVGALSRLHRLTDLFGEVLSVNCQQQYGTGETVTDYYKTCLCTAQLWFKNGLLAQVMYGKGEAVWQSERKFAVYGEQGGLILDGDIGTLVRAQETTLIDVGGRQGLFTKDTLMVLDYLMHGTPLYVTPEQSLYALKVADAARESANTGLTIFLTDD